MAARRPRSSSGPARKSAGARARTAFRARPPSLWERREGRALPGHGPRVQVLARPRLRVEPCGTRVAQEARRGLAGPGGGSRNGHAGALCGDSAAPVARPLRSAWVKVEPLPTFTPLRGASQLSRTRSAARWCAHAMDGATRLTKTAGFLVSRAVTLRLKSKQELYLLIKNFNRKRNFFP